MMTDKAFDPSQHTILLVEDDESFRTSLRKVLAKENYRILEAASGKEGAAFGTDAGVDLIILDYYLGDMTGADFLRSLAGRFLVPVILLSANHNPEMDEEVRRLGAASSFEKPVDRRELLTAVKTAISSKDGGVQS